MSPTKKVCVLAVVMVLFFIPVMSDSAAGSVHVDNDSVHVTRGFDDRTAGALSITMENRGATDILVNITIGGNYPHTGHVYALRENVAIPYGEHLTVEMSFHIGDPGIYWVNVIVTDALADEGAAPLTQINHIQITVSLSIWSNTWTYIAIVLVIIIVAIAAFIKMRGNPKVEESGAFTAMEEERKAGKSRSGTKREEYKGRRR